MFAVSGTDGFLRRRKIKALLDDHRAKGWRIEQVDGAQPRALEMALGAAGGLLTAPQTLMLLRNPQKVPISDLERYSKSLDRNTIILMHVEDKPRKNSKFYRFLDGLPKAVKKEVNLPEKEYKRKEHAQEFVTKEALLHGKTIPGPLTVAIVDRLGTNFGFLSMEILKVCTLADVEGTEEISADQVKRAMAPLTLTDTISIADMLACRNTHRVALLLQRIRREAKGIPTIAVGAALGGIVMTWLEALSIKEAGRSDDEVAALMGKNPWYIKNILLPSLRKWKATELIPLLQGLAKSVRLVTSGGQHHWEHLCACILDSCRTR